MSYILDALTRSQQQRQPATIPTLATVHPGEGSPPPSANPWRGTAIGLASVAVVVAVYFLSSRAPAATEPAAPLAAAVAGSARAALALPRAGKDGVARDAPGSAGVHAREAAGQGQPNPERSATDASSAITRVRADAPQALPGRRLSPGSRRLVDELLALRREATVDAPRGQAPSPARQEKQQDPAAGVPGRDVSRRPAPGDNPPPANAPAGTASGPPMLRELPLETQAALPALEINVHAYAQSRDARMVMINMTRYGEGDRLREGLRIDAITPTGVVLVFDNQRFQLPVR